MSILNKCLKLIVEDDFRDFNLIIEQKNPNEPKFLKVSGPYIVTEKKNANGRVYDRKLMESVIQTFVETKIKTGQSMGELNHPTHTNINPKEACHRITSLIQSKENETIWIGESIVLTSSSDGTIKGTPNGDILASIVQHGGKIGMSTRGVGEINEHNRIDKDYTLITVDCVTDPSGPGCFVDGILESKNFMVNVHGEIVEIAYDHLNKRLDNIPTHSVTTEQGNKYIYDCFKQFITEINLKTK